MAALADSWLLWLTDGKMFQQPPEVIDDPVVPVVRPGSLVMSPHPSELLLIRLDYSQDECSQQCLSWEMKQ
jgi:hypothetical protein